MKKTVNLVLLCIMVVTLAGFTYTGWAQSKEADRPVTCLFVQNARSGTFRPIEGEDNLYTLTLQKVSPQTVYFTDRPERYTGQVSTGEFLGGLGFPKDNPPNAAIEILNVDAQEDVVVVELFAPNYDPDKSSLQYKVSILKQPDHSYAVFNDRHDGKIPQSFGAVALFIDGCPKTQVVCKQDSGKVCGWTDCAQCYSCNKVNTFPPCTSRKPGGSCGLWPHCWPGAMWNAVKECEDQCQEQFGPECDNFDEW